MNILAIGNSFSQDATRYLAGIAEADGVSMTVENLYIGGCPLSRHFSNIQSGEKAYLMEIDGEDTGVYVSVEEALLSRKWDYITLQQVSNDSINYNTYQPYLNDIYEYVKKLAPDAKIVIHQTWAYEEGSQRLCEELKYKKQHEMFSDIKAAYEKAAEAIDAYMIIPSGEMFQGLIKRGFSIHRDTFHASLGLGRYALGLLWYVMLTGNSVLDNKFSDFDEPVSEETVRIIKEEVEIFRKRD